MHLCVFSNLFWGESFHQASVLVVSEQLKQQLTQSSMQREEIIRHKQELQLLGRDLLLAGPIHFWHHKPTAGTDSSLVTFIKMQILYCHTVLVSFIVYFFIFKNKNNSIWSINCRNVKPDFLKIIILLLFLNNILLTRCWCSHVWKVFNKILFFLFPGEGDSWKDELLELARSKQERMTSELRCLRQVSYTDNSVSVTKNIFLAAQNQNKHWEIVWNHLNVQQK